MKKTLIILPFVFISLIAQAEEENFCPIDTSMNSIEALQEANCDITDTMRSCAEVAVDPNEQRNRIENWFKVTEDRKDKIISDKRSVAPLGWGSLFHQEKVNGQYQLTHINDFMSFGGTVPSEKAAKLKETITDQYVKFAEKFNCDPYIKTKYTITYFPNDTKFKTRQEYVAFTQKSTFQAEKEAHFNKYNNLTTNNTVCSPKPSQDIREWKTVAITYPPCAGNVSGFFKDNEWTSSTLDSSINGPEASELAACIKDRISKGGQIEHIKIESSASALNNTGEAAKRFCKKGFKELSDARAITARDRIVPQLFSKAGVDATGLVVKTDSTGSNGDGTSGPCPYEIRDGREVLKREFSTPAGKKSLDGNKFVRVNVSFKEVKKPVSSNDSFFAQTYPCRSYEFACQPKRMTESKVGQGSTEQ